MGDGVHCKHVAALLLTWLNEPERFQEIEPLENALNQKKKADLILLIRQMITRFPELEELVHLSARGDADGTAPINADLIRRQVVNAIKHGDYGHDYYGAAQAIANELDTIMQQGEIYRAKGDWVNAAIIYCTVIDELHDQYDQIYDHDGDLGTVFGDGSEYLGTCLQTVEQSKPRLDILRTLVGIVIDGIKIGGYGFSDTAYDVVLEQTTSAGKMEIVTWVEAEVAKIGSLTDFSSKWQAESYGRFLLNIQAESLNDEEYIALCRRTGQLKKLVERLLELERVNEAIHDAQTASDYELLALADLFVTHGHDETAETLIWERSGTSGDTRLDGWLKDRAVANGDWKSAWQYTENQFWRRPTVDSYRELKVIAENLGDWSERQKDILARLTEKEGYGLLTRIYLLENNVEAALATLPKVKYGGDLAIDVARAAEESHPVQAIKLYQQNAERLIAVRGRGNYALAAEYLKRVQLLYTKLQEPEKWEAYIQVVRDQKPRLPAFLHYWMN